MKFDQTSSNMIKSIIMEAGSNLRKLYNQVIEVTEKDPKDFVTSADIEINEYIIQRIKEFDDKSNIYSEEDENRQFKRNQWIIDPIDGTANFILGIPHFSISITYIKNYEPIAAYIYNPMTQELFWTEPHYSAMLNDNEIRVSQRHAIENQYGLIGFSANMNNINKYVRDYPDYFNETRKSIGILSPSLSICAVARGKADYFIDFGCSPEGKVGGALILQKAGGRIYNYDKTEYDYKSVGIFATN
jgi:myo-inositol-1(or 4)-monophosphatase